MVHGGDLFFRSKIPKQLIPLVYDPLIELADSGIPIVLVPGNHERGRFPAPLLLGHSNIMVFDSPRFFDLTLNGIDFQLTGFPFFRGDIRSEFKTILNQSNYLAESADIRLLCLHQAVDGCRVKGYTFRNKPDVVSRSDIPGIFSAVLVGHIHRFQVLPHLQSGNSFQPPVVFSGSIERTSFQESCEDKGFCILNFTKNETDHSELTRIQFKQLPARPMIDLDLEENSPDISSAESYLAQKLHSLPDDAIVRLKADTGWIQKFPDLFRLEVLRQIAPDTMNIQFHSSIRQAFQINKTIQNHSQISDGQIL